MNAQGGIFDLETLAQKIRALEAKMAQPDFWKDPKRAQETIASLKEVKASWEPWTSWEKSFRDLVELSAAVEETDEALTREIAQELRQLEKKFQELELRRLLGKPEDRASAILNLNAGAGGTESCDWAEMLSRMYVRWAEDKGYKVETLDLLPGEGAGIKNATLLIKGDYAYGFLKSEVGVHRLVRISPFDSNKRRHTSFASVDVIPEASDEIQIEIKESDLRIDTYRSSGKGGQHVNVTDSAVRITHLPTGIVTQCQNERSQYKNKATAMKVLKARLMERERRIQQEKLQAAYGQKQEIAWGSQIRSYVFQPYQMVKDHRTDVETSNTTEVMDGGIDVFIQAYLESKAKRVDG